MRYNFILPAFFVAVLTIVSCADQKTSPTPVKEVMSQPNQLHLLHKRHLEKHLISLSSATGAGMAINISRRLLIRWLRLLIV